MFPLRFSVGKPCYAVLQRLLYGHSLQFSEQVIYLFQNAFSMSVTSWLGWLHHALIHSVTVSTAGGFKSFFAVGLTFPQCQVQQIIRSFLSGTYSALSTATVRKPSKLWKFLPVNTSRWHSLYYRIASMYITQTWAHRGRNMHSHAPFLKMLLGLNWMVLMLWPFPGSLCICSVRKVVLCGSLPLIFHDNDK